MTKAMIFIDGTWFYKSQSVLEQEFGGNYKIDLEKLPTLISNVLAKQLKNDVMIVRTYFYGSIPVNFNPVDQPYVDNQQNFYDLLKGFHYEVETYPIDFRDRRLRFEDRVAENPKDEFYPAEKCVDVALATGMLYFATIPCAYDIAIAVVGDEDFRPVLQHVRSLGRRVAIVTIKSNALAAQYRDPLDSERIRDFDTIYLNDYLADLQFKVESRQVECASPNHIGNRTVSTTLRLPEGVPFYCDKCREGHRAEMTKVDGQIREKIAALPTLDPAVYDSAIPGVIRKLVKDRKFGFVCTSSGNEYRFHLNDLEDVSYDDLKEMDVLAFKIKSEPYIDASGKLKAGIVCYGVRLVAETVPGNL